MNRGYCSRALALSFFPLVSLLASFVPCAHSAQPVTTVSVSSAPDTDFVSTLLNCTVRIRYQLRRDNCLVTGHGTAFGTDLSAYGYAGRRYLLTACHNVLDEKGQPYTTLQIETTSNGQKLWTACKVLACDKNLDISIVESPEDLPQVLELGTREAESGNAVVMPGSPRGIPVTIYPGIVLNRFERGSARTSARIQFDHGDSGAPVVCATSRKIAGIAVAGIPKDGDLDRTIGLFVPLAGMMSFLKANQRTNTPAVTTPEMPLIPAVVPAAAEVARRQASDIKIETSPVETVVLQAR